MKTFPNLSKTLLLSLVSLLWPAVTARAVDFQVSTAQEFQNALTLAAANGADDTITITNGYYLGNFSYNSSEDRNLTIQAAAGVANTDIALDGNAGGRALNITCSGSSVAVTVRGVTFLRNCGNSSLFTLQIDAGTSGTISVEECRFLSPPSTTGGGLNIAKAHDATVTNCTVTGLPSYIGNGVSIANVGNEVLVQNCTFTTNYASGSGGGLSIISGSSVGVLSNYFFGNRASSSGGGAYVSASSAAVSIKGNTFASGLANSGGGAYVIGSPATVVEGNVFLENAGNLSGGGLVLSGGSNVANNVFRSNSGGAGAGASISSGAPVISGNSFDANSSTGLGGGGLYLSGNSQVTNNTFSGNSASSSGGALYCNSSSPLVSRNEFRSNIAAQNGGAIYVAGVNPVITDNLITGNSQSGATYFGGGVYVNASGTLDLLNNTITQNSAAGGGGGVRFQVSGVVEVLNVFNNIIWGNSAGGSGADVLVTGTGASKTFQFNDAHDSSGIWTLFDNNIDLAPEFFDPVNGDYHIQNTSPCKDAGTNGVANLPATDLDNEPRIADGTVDMGCYEFSTAAAHPADVDTNFNLTISEFTAYAAAWKSGQTWSNPPVIIPADYVTRAGYLMTNGGIYHNDGSARPVNWKVGP